MKQLLIPTVLSGYNHQIQVTKKWIFWDMSSNTIKYYLLL